MPTISHIPSPTFKLSTSTPLTSSTDTESRRDPTHTPDITPSPTPPASTQPATPANHLRDRQHPMDSTSSKVDGQVAHDAQPTTTEGAVAIPKEAPVPKTKKSCTKKHCSKKHKNTTKSKKDKKKRAKEESSDDDGSSSAEDSDSETEEDQDSSDADSEDSEDSVDEQKQKKKQRARKALKKLQRQKKKKRSPRKAKSRKQAETESDCLSDADSEAEEEASEEDSDLSDEEPPSRKSKKSKAKKRKSTKHRKVVDDPVDEDEESGSADDIQAKIDKLNLALASSGRRGRRSRLPPALGKKKRRRSGKKAERGSKLEYKRVDELWDRSIHDYKLTDTAEHEDADEYDQYVFTVRRKFDWEGKYNETVVDIRSKLLKEILTEVMDGVKGVSLVEETPTVDPNLLFLYLEELRTAYKLLRKTTPKEKKRKTRKRNQQKIQHMKILIKYLDVDYADTKKTLYPMLESKTITFDLLWALLKPNTVAYTSTYGNQDEPRAFMIEYVSKEYSFTKGQWYSIEGRYLEYDGKSFGMGSMEVDIESFKGPRKIAGLAAYPLTYHKDEAAVRKLLIERGRKFVALKGMNYRSHKGMAFFKKKRSVIKVNINGRIMVDPAIHRRINPNYPISTVRPKDPDEQLLSDDSDEDSCCCSGSDSEDEGHERDRERAGGGLGSEETKEKTKTKVIVDGKGDHQFVQVTVDADGEEIIPEKMDAFAEEKKERVFTDDELLLASPVVLGFAFGEKLWLEFTVSGISDIDWNEGAFDSLVLPENQKSIVKALVESHTFHAAQNIDDVIQGKGRGLVAVLHGGPGLGKTLTAEGIAELLKCPLYMVSAGELGTDPRTLEAELNKILDIAHSWGAVLLLDEADVFLEKRTIQDIHRNALVSIFLRLLEYFQGILFLTTNRVETFDDAFQSRIHIALRYGELTTAAKKTVWKMFLARVQAVEGVQIATFREDDYDTLARHMLNGRQIKNCVRTAQALAVNNGENLSMTHIKRVLDVAESFDHDLRGGTGYMDAMRSYT